MLGTLRAVWFPVFLGLVQALAGFGTSYFDEQTDRWYACVATTALTAIFLTFLGAISLLRARAASLRDDSYRTLLTALSRIANVADLDTDNIGVSAYHVRFHLKRFRLEQVRISRVRLSNAHAATPFSWTRGKGVVGTCWAQQNRPVWWKCKSRVKNCANEEMWKCLPEDERVGLSFAEAKQLNRYGGMVAFPVIRQGGWRAHYIGCVTLDALDEETWAALEQHQAQVNQELGDAAAAIEKTIGENA